MSEIVKQVARAIREKHMRLRFSSASGHYFSIGLGAGMAEQLAQAAITAHESLLVEENERLREALREIAEVLASEEAMRGAAVNVLADFLQRPPEARAALEQGK